MIDQRAFPSSLDDLVRQGYLRDLPLDPITGKAEWRVDIGETWIAGKHTRGITDVHSNAPGNSSDGSPYRDS